MESTAKPLISVVMPVYNALPFLDDSVNSILTQTFTDFEFVIFDDASTDGSVERLREWAARDARIHLHGSSTQLGLSGSSNAVVSRSRAAIIARMDADDISHPDRLKRQLQVIENAPDVAVVGTLCNGIDARRRDGRPRDR
jgi:glycosyltransferase involved in cell wall biosynthesis